ncbi:MAG TPA: response regulator [Gammaproteobacteria bacterium]|nr:response regulator [Gammaproteobacteria bacterium]
MPDAAGTEAAAILALIAGGVNGPGGSGDLHEATKQLGAALEFAELGTWAWDLPDGRITWSAEQYRLFGHEPHSFEPTFDIMRRQLPPDDFARAWEEFLAAQRDARAFAAEYRVIWPNGETHWVQARARFVFDEHGRAVQMFGVTIDVDRLKRAEQTASEAHARVQTIAEATPGTIFTYRVAVDGAISFPYAGPHLRDTHGIDPEALMRDPSLLLSRIHPDDAKLVTASTEESARTLSMWHAQFRHNHPEKGEVWLEAYSSPLREPDGAVIWHGIAHDITHVKRAELELLEAQQRAETADRAKSEFLANMSHEIRTPMSAIMGYADILRTSLTAPEDVENVQTIASNGAYLLRLIDDILDLSRIEAGKLDPHFERVRPDTLVREVCTLLKIRAIEKGLALNVLSDGLLPETIRTDPTRLRQILINLVENALKFTDAGEINVVMHLLRRASLLLIDVVDTGPGISEATLARLFEPFTQGDSSATRRFGGTGLGLSICRPFARMLGGDLVVKTREGSGTTFTLAIGTGDLEGVPLVDPFGDAAPRAKQQAPTRSLACRVLVVDDREEIRRLARRMLEDAGANVEVAVDGRDALRQVAAAAAAFDAIILDMQMPVLDGYAAAAELRRRGYDRPIIALTASAMKEDESLCLASGCDHYLSKPLERSTLVNAIAWCTQDLSRAQLARERAERTAARPSRAPKVLFVDDNPDACNVAKKMLERAGCQVATATTGPAALAVSGPFDAVVLDLGLPGMSGEQVMADLRGRPELKVCKFICLSGRALVEREWHRLGFDHYLLKPARFEELAKLVGGAMGQRELGSDPNSVEVAAS